MYPRRRTLIWFVPGRVERNPGRQRMLSSRFTTRLSARRTRDEVEASPSLKETCHRGMHGQIEDTAFMDRLRRISSTSAGGLTGPAYRTHMHLESGKQKEKGAHKRHRNEQDERGQNCTQQGRAESAARCGSLRRPNESCLSDRLSEKRPCGPIEVRFRIIDQVVREVNTL